MSELRIKELLSERGMTQAQLAARLRISTVSMSRMLTRDNLSMNSLRRIASALGCTIGELFTSPLRCPHCGKTIEIKIE